jgi:hypothetical protein
MTQQLIHLSIIYRGSGGTQTLGPYSSKLPDECTRALVFDDLKAQYRGDTRAIRELAGIFSKELTWDNLDGLKIVVGTEELLFVVEVRREENGGLARLLEEMQMGDSTSRPQVTQGAGNSLVPGDKAMKWYNVRVLIPVYNSRVYALDEQGLQGALSHYVTDGSLRYMSLADTQTFADHGTAKEEAEKLLQQPVLDKVRGAVFGLQGGIVDGSLVGPFCRRMDMICLG